MSAAGPYPADGKKAGAMMSAVVPTATTKLRNRVILRR